MKVWLAGARGILGSALAKRLADGGLPHVATDVELDITDRPRLVDFAERERPSVVLNAASSTRVDAIESNEAEATQVNALGAEYVALAAARVGARVVHFSSDYVFDGRATAPYAEDAPCAPLNAYGRTKLEGERRLLTLTGVPVYVVRTSGLFGGSGPSFVRAIVRALADQDEVRVVTDQVGRPTYSVDLARATLELCGLTGRAAAPPGLYHFANTGAVSRYDFARAILEAARERGLPVRTGSIVAITSDRLALPARRPAYSVLATERIERALGWAPRPFQDALRDHLVEL